MKFLMAAVATIAVLVLHAPLGLAQTSSDPETLAEKDVPGAVKARVGCKSPSGPMTRRAFSAGFVFVQSCSDSPQPLVRVVFATDRDGTGARLLQFHRPEGRRMSALASVAFFPAENEISGTTGRLTRRICRAEGRWRMEGKKPAPGLVFWRQNRDCEGATGWRTVLGRAR